MRDISHNLEVAKPGFLYFIKNMDAELSQWIQYYGVSLKGKTIFFNFKSSQNSLSFSVYGGVNAGDVHDLLKGKTNEIYQFFKDLKYENL